MTDQEFEPAGQEDVQIGPGWYVIEGFHQDPARVVAGPMDRESAKSRALMVMDPNAKIMHTPGLVYSIQEHGYSVEWAEKVEKPQSLHAENNLTKEQNP